MQKSYNFIFCSIYTLIGFSNFQKCYNFLFLIFIWALKNLRHKGTKIETKSWNHLQPYLTNFVIKMKSYFILFIIFFRFLLSLKQTYSIVNFILNTLTALLRLVYKVKKYPLKFWKYICGKLFILKLITYVQLIIRLL